MAFETALDIVQNMLQLDPVILLVLVFAFAYLAFRVFQVVLRILFTGVAFALFPVVANVIGIPIPLTFQSVLWSAFLGIAIYFVYMGMSFAFRLLNWIFSPLKKAFAKGGKAKAKGK